MELHNERVALAEGLRFLGEVPPEHVVLMLSPDGDIQSWSKAAGDLFGWSADEVLGRAAELLYDRGRAGAVRSGAIEQAADYRTKNGTSFRGLTTITALEDERGRLRGYVMLVETSGIALPLERYAPRVELADRMLRTVGVGVTVQDASGRLLYANETAARLCGYATAGELVSAPVESLRARFALLDERGASVSLEELPGARVLAGEEPEPIMIQVRERATGRRWWARIFAKGVRNPDGRAELAINVWHDVTEQQREKESVQHLLELTASLMMTLDYETRLDRLADDLVPRLADWCAIDLIENGARRPLVLRGIDPAKVETVKALALARTNGTFATMNVSARLMSPLQESDLAAVATDRASLEVLRALRLRSAIVVPISHDGRPTGALVLATSASGRMFDPRDLDVARELGERASTLLDNARSYRTALEAVRMRDDFLSIAAHELRTPLASLSLLLETLIESAGERKEPDLVRRLDLGMRQVRRLGDLIEVLLDVGRLTSDHLVLDYENVDVSALVHEVAARSAPLAERAGCELRVTAEELCHAEIDRLRIDQVISNVISNAIKYGAARPVDIACSKRDGRVHVTVRDRGIGIAPGDHERIFRRFERAVGDRHYAGLGLGLWIVREIVAAHGGRIEVTSARGEGATFEITLPQSRDKG